MLWINLSERVRLNIFFEIDAFMKEYRRESVEIIGEKGSVKNTFLRGYGKGSKLAIVFPGFGYTCHMPLLYYPTRLLLQKGFDVLWVETDYSTNKKYIESDDLERSKWIKEDALAACRAALSAHGYTQLVLIGKSIGTAALAALLTYKALPEDSRFIWLTPVINDDEVRAMIIKNPRRNSLFLAGMEDPHYSQDHLREIQEATGANVLALAHANHSLEVKGDVFLSIAILKMVIEGIEKMVS